jgi:hypothetical protein
VHPDYVAELVQREFVDLRAGVAAADLPIEEVRLRDPTRIEIEFTARQREAEVVLAGLITPGAAPGQFQQPGFRVPLLGREHTRRLVLAVGCENWDGTPPTAELLLPDGSPLPEGEWPQDYVNRGIVIGHPEYDRKFFCRPGFREYHSHPVHKDDPWDEHREGFSLSQLLLGLVTDLTKRWTLAPP